MTKKRFLGLFTRSSILKNPLLSNTPESSLQIDLVAPGRAWPQPPTIPADKPSISASELPPQHHEVEIGLTHKVNFSYTHFPKSDFLSNIKFPEKATSCQISR
jgi:hypothetical protein